MIDELDGSSSTLRLLASQALKSWTVAGLLNLLLEDDVIVRTSAARELQLRGGEEAFNRLTQHLCDVRDEVREIAAFTLGQLGTPEFPFRTRSLLLLLPLANDQAACVRACAAAAIGHLCYDSMSSDAEDVLLRLAKDLDKDVRACAAYALSNGRDSPRIREALATLASDPEEEVRKYADLGSDILGA